VGIQASGVLTMAAPAVAASEPADLWYRALMSRAVRDGNDHEVACMVASWQAGNGAMPDWLGLAPAAFYCLLAHHFPGAVWRPAPAGRVPIARGAPG
jgi:nitrogen fixation protein NifQ